MKVLIVEKDKRLYEEFTKTRLFQVSVQSNLQLLSQLDVQAVLIDSDTVPVHTLIEKMVFLDEFQFVFYVMKEEDKDVLDLCKANQVIPLISENTEEIYNLVKKILYPENAINNRLFLFLGSDRKAGTSTIVHGVAHTLVEMTTKKVLVISLTTYKNSNVLEYSKSSIDHLRTSISSRVVTFDEVLRESEKLHNYHFVAGAEDMIQALNFLVEDILYLIEALKKQEDFIVLLDCGGDLNNPLVMAALQRVNNKFMVVKHLNSYYKKLEQHMTQVLSVHPLLSLDYQSFKYIINEFDETDSATFLKDKRCISVAKIPKSYYGVVAETDYINLANIDNTFANAVSAVSNLIAIQSGTKIEKVEEKVGFFKRYFNFGKKKHIEKEGIANGFST